MKPVFVTVGWAKGATEPSILYVGLSGQKAFEAGEAARESGDYRGGYIGRNMISSFIPVGTDPKHAPANPTAQPISNYHEPNLSAQAEAGSGHRKGKRT